ncbi:cytochrome b5 [Suhomyces tanzawaensis NRRL Y-17324]|uniref:Cytochrome b5 n=1 Tax=Suhomyces tanzawaensis NRRL Y-17324 TaxID=984487 RepID=A0A1E4SK03_9ASCO|nr:cytochrome b5 [Suhomyces tanzawaensis NRRL Y-17324]ODV79833.1 cytochrome b5 [Suhomyces tanzawaensis NRRL Y-17324]
MSELTEAEVYNQDVDIHTLPIYTRSQLADYDGIKDPHIYVAIRGYIYDVTANANSYGPGKGYHKLVGKDVSRLLGLNRLVLAETDENTWNTDDFDDKQNQAVDNWVAFFRKRYRIIGVVVHHQR